MIGLDGAYRTGADSEGREEAQMAQATESQGVERHAFIKSFHGIRYQVKDVARAVALLSH